MNRLQDKHTVCLLFYGLCLVFLPLWRYCTAYVPRRALASGLPVIARMYRFADYLWGFWAATTADEGKPKTSKIADAFKEPSKACV